MTTLQPTWKRAAGLALALAIGFAPGAALARGAFKGTFGREKFKSRKLLVACGYTRSSGYFSISGAQVTPKKQKTAAISGVGADPTAGGKVFPIVLTETQASFSIGGGVTTPAWIAKTDGVVVTLTAYRKGRIFGKATGSLEGVAQTSGTIKATARFNGKCLIQ